MCDIVPIVNTVMQSITYIVPAGRGNDCLLVDCGDTEEVIRRGVNVRGVLLTHAHFDHIYGLNLLFETFPSVPVYTNEVGREALLSPRMNLSRYSDECEDFTCTRPENISIITHEGPIATIDNPPVEVLFTPGHHPSCLSYRIGRRLFTGDSYIPGVELVTHIPLGDKLLAKQSLTTLQALEREGLEVMPGHHINP